MQSNGIQGVAEPVARISTTSQKCPIECQLAVVAVGLGCSQLTRITRWVGVYYVPPPRTKFPSGAPALGFREATAAGPGIVEVFRRGQSTTAIRKNGRSRVAQGRIDPLAGDLRRDRNGDRNGW